MATSRTSRASVSESTPAAVKTLDEETDATQTRGDTSTESVPDHVTNAIVNATQSPPRAPQA